MLPRYLTIAAVLFALTAMGLAATHYKIAPGSSYQDMLDSRGEAFWQFKIPLAIACWVGCLIANLGLAAYLIRKPSQASFQSLVGAVIMLVAAGFLIWLSV